MSQLQNCTLRKLGTKIQQQKTANMKNTKIPTCICTAVQIHFDASQQMGGDKVTMYASMRHVTRTSTNILRDDHNMETNKSNISLFINWHRSRKLKFSTNEGLHMLASSAQVTPDLLPSLLLVPSSFLIPHFKYCQPNPVVSSSLILFL